MYEFMQKYAASAAACHRMSKQRYAEDQSLTQVRQCLPILRIVTAES